MRFRNAIITAGAALVAASATAQAQQCAAGATQDACQKTTDVFNFVTPQIAGALAGGSTTLGQGGVLGGLPHWVAAIHLSAVMGDFPKTSSIGFNTSGKQASSFPAQHTFVPMASVDGSIGLFSGIPLGVTKVGGVDLLLNATYVPKLPDGGDVKLSLPGGSTKIGGGLRIGLLQQSILVPGVSFSYVKRALPTLSLSGGSKVTASGVSAPGSFAVNDLNVKTSSWRLSASKTLLLFGLEGGFGQDTYDNSASIRVTVNAPAPIGTQTTNAKPSYTMKRTNVYGGVIVNFILFKLVGEVGQVSGGKLPTATNSFGSDAAKSRLYFSTGIRAGF